ASSSRAAWRPREARPADRPTSRPRAPRTLRGCPPGTSRRNRRSGRAARPRACAGTWGRRGRARLRASQSLNHERAMGEGRRAKGDAEESRGPAFRYALRLYADDTVGVRRRIPVAILGATGTVGQRFVERLADHPWFEIAAVTASDRSEGKLYGDAARWRLSSPLPEAVARMTVRATKPDLPCRAVFSALDAATAL